MFEVIVGEKGLKYSWQDKFPKQVVCVHCKGKAQIGFVVFEDADMTSKKEFVCDNKPKGDGLWLHDCCAVAVYFCRSCLETTSLYNQG